jgi:putative glycosyltransferase
MRLSIVTTMYRSAPYLREFHARASAAAAALTDDHEIVYVNDGSPDDSLEIVLGLRESDDHVRVIDLSRNFGHHQAMWTGLQHARGELVFLIDCDLEEDPGWLTAFTGRLDETGADVVYGVQGRRGEGRLRRWCSEVSYKLVNALCDERLPQNLMTVRLMTRRYLDALLRHTEVAFTIAGLWARTGFEQVAFPVTKGQREEPTYSFLRRAQVFVHSVTAFSDKPLLYVFYLGVAILAGSGLVSLFLVARTLLLGDMLGGWPSLMLSVWFLGGLIIFCQGVLGAYLARVYREAKRRPISLVRHVYDSRAAAVKRSREVA